MFFSPCTLMMFGGLVHNKKKKKKFPVHKTKLQDWAGKLFLGI
jgi:hypothetical protein